MINTNSIRIPYEDQFEYQQQRLDHRLLRRNHFICNNSNQQKLNQP